MENFKKGVVIVLVIYLYRACSAKIEILNLSKNCKICKKFHYISIIYQNETINKVLHDEYLMNLKNHFWFFWEFREEVPLSECIRWTFLTYSPSRLPEANTIFFEKYICRDVNTSIRFSKFPNELKQRDIVAAHNTKSKVVKEDYMDISIHIKLSLLNVEVVIDLLIYRASISGPDPNLII